MISMTANNAFLSFFFLRKNNIYLHYKQSPVDGLGDVCVYGHKLSFIKPEAKLATLLAYPHLHKSDTFFWVFLFKGKKEREREPCTQHGSFLSIS